MSKKNKNNKKNKKVQDVELAKGTEALTLNAYKKQLLNALHFLELRNVMYQDANFGIEFVKNVNGRVIITTTFRIEAFDYYSYPFGERDRMGTGFMFGLENLKDANEIQILTIPQKFDYENLIIKERAKQLKSKSITRLNPKSLEIINAINYEDRKALEAQYDNSYIPTYYLQHKHSTKLKPNQLNNDNYADLVNKEIEEAIEAAVQLLFALQAQKVFKDFYILSGELVKELINYTFSGLHIKEQEVQAHLSTLNAIEDAKFSWDDKINTFINELEYDLKLKKREIDSYNDSSNVGEDEELAYMNTIYQINLKTLNDLKDHAYKRVMDENGKPYTRLDFLNDTK